MGHVLAALMPQNRLIARVCLHTGLRVGDVVSLRTQDIGLQMMVTEAKTKKRRRVGLTASLLAAIRAQAGPEWAFPGNHPYLRHGRQAPRRQAQAGQAPQTARLTSYHRRGKLGGVLREGGIPPTQQNKNFVELEGGFEYK
ncbi:tyrosine-type recombinase/integrase [Flavonifractor plautii]|uniref:tyrosine-type recombinase/integrase n=1 Tax=Flavonifractor plautii TaxID=292800 RepID=UPI003D2EE233